MTITTPRQSRGSLLRRVIRCVLLVIAVACLIAASLTAEATESDFAAGVAAHHALHSDTCSLRCPLDHRSHNDLVTGWPAPLLPLGLLLLSATSLFTALRIAPPDSDDSPLTLGSH